MTLDEAVQAFRDTLKDHATDMVHHWSDEMTENYGFRMSLGPEDAILLHLPDGQTVRLVVLVGAVEATP